jgi:hypothetical protein
LASAYYEETSFLATFLASFVSSSNRSSIGKKIGNRTNTCAVVGSLIVAIKEIRNLRFKINEIFRCTGKDKKEQII